MRPFFIPIKDVLLCFVCWLEISRKTLFIIYNIFFLFLQINIF